MSTEAYEQKMYRWKTWIDRHLQSGTSPTAESES
jgi:hypothetical protein